jgi:hypothetical protein
MREHVGADPHASIRKLMGVGVAFNASMYAHRILSEAET